jgi:hypothetical protein
LKILPYTLLIFILFPPLCNKKLKYGSHLSGSGKVVQSKLAGSLEIISVLTVSISAYDFLRDSGK